MIVHCTFRKIDAIEVTRQNGWTSQAAGARITLEAGKQNGAEPHAEGWSNGKSTIHRHDVHQESIAIALADGDGSAPQDVAIIPTDKLW